MDKDILNYLLEKNPELWECPYLLTWLIKEIIKLDEVPITPIREGTPKGDKYPLPRYKVLLSLFNAVMPKVSRKKFAEFFDIPHGTVLNWAKGQGDSDRVNAYTKDFMLSWRFKFHQLVKGDGWEIYMGTYDDFGLNKYIDQPLEWEDEFLNLNRLQQFLFEIRHYTPWILEGIIKSLKFKEEMLDGDYRKGFSMFRLALLPALNKDVNVKEFKKILQDHYKDERKIFRWYFHAINELVLDGEVEDAVKIIKFLQRAVVEDLIQKYHVLLIEDDCKRFQSKKYKKTEPKHLFEV